MVGGFNWIDKPYLAGMARPHTAEALAWVRSQGVDVLITLTEDPLPKSWVDDAGLMAMHVPIQDFEPPTIQQLEQIATAMRNAKLALMGFGVHCLAGRGRTGTVLAAMLVAEGVEPAAAIQRIRTARPGSIETNAQEQAVHDWAEHVAKRTQD